MTYKHENISRRKTILFSFITIAIPVLVIVMGYLVYVGVRTSEVYSHIKANKRGFVGETHIGDPRLGYKPAPGSSGKGNMMVGDPFPMHFNQNGFRIPEDGVQPQREHESQDNISIMTLGDSYTFGLGINADETYSYRIGKENGARVHNAGVPGYGIAQIVTRARNLVPEHEPDYLVVQYSPWLIKRSTQYYAPSHVGKVPAPYYYENNDGNHEIADPVFIAPQEKLPYDEYRFTAESGADFASFYFRVGLPLFVRQDLLVARHSVASALGWTPEPANNPRAIIRHSYNELSKLVQEVDGQMLILVLGKDQGMDVPNRLFPQGVPVVNAQRVLVNALDQPTRSAYRRTWWVWRGQPPRLADIHPNVHAHAVIADLLGSAIHRLEKGAGP